MFVRLKPDVICRDIHSIPFDRLRQEGVTVIAFDVDNTLGLQDCRHFERKVADLLKGLSQNFTIVLATNNTKERSHLVKPFRGLVICPGYKNGRWIPRKPNRGFFEEIKRATGAESRQILMVGDKYFFDVNPAKKAGMRAALVNPMGKDLWGDRLIRLRRIEERALAKLGLKRAS